MKHLKTLLKVLRTKQWIKNLLIFAAPIGAGIGLNGQSVKTGIIGFLIFSLFASFVYVVNDFHDRAKDSIHPLKKYRPIASGSFSTRLVPVLLIGLIGMATVLAIDLDSNAIFTLFCYLTINLLYTFSFKNFASVELGLVASGYALRVLFGAQIYGLRPSSWLMISTFSAAFGVVAAKRRAELDDVERNMNDKRLVLSEYSSSGLQSTVTLAFGTSFTAYSLWLFEHSASLEILPILCGMLALIIFSYLLIESDRGNLESPENLVKEKTIFISSCVFVILNLLLVYTK
jgi:decaprenyl-phosphate phosphoribosyltransferase